MKTTHILTVLLILPFILFGQDDTLNKNHTIADSLVKQELYLEALPFLQKSHLEYLSTNDSKGLAVIWQEMYKAYSRSNMRDSTINHVKKGELWLQDEHFIPEAKAKIATYLGNIHYYNYGDYSTAKMHFQSALKNYKSQSIKYEKDIMLCLIEMSRISIPAGDSQVAKECINEAKNIANKLNDQATLITLKTLIILSHATLGELKEVIEKWSALKEEINANKLINFTPRQQRDIETAYGSYLEMTGDYEKMTVRIEEKIAKSTNPSEMGVVHHYATLSNLYSYLKDYEKSIFYGEKAFTIMKKANNEIPNVMRFLFENLPRTYQEIHKYDKAKELIREGLKFSFKYPTYRRQSYPLYGILGSILHQEGNLDEAEENYLIAINIIDTTQVGAFKNLRKMILYSSLQNLSVSRKDKSKARFYIEEAERERTEALVSNNDNASVSSTTWLNDYRITKAQTLAFLGDYEAAFESLLENENELLRRTQEKDMMYVLFNNYYVWGNMLHKKWETSKNKRLSDLEKSFEKMQEALKIEEKQLSETPVSLQNVNVNSFLPALKGSFFPSIASIAYALCENSQNHSTPDLVLNVLEKGKANSLMQARQTEFIAIPEKIKEEEKNYYSIINHLEGNLKSIKDEEILITKELELKHVKEKLFTLHTKMQETYPEYFSYQRKNDLASIESLQNILKKGTLLIEYLSSPINSEDTNLFLVSIDEEKAITKQLTLITDINQKIKQFNTLLKSPTLFRTDKRKKFIELSHELYNQFIAPIEDQLAGKERLVIIGDGMTHYLPFEVLLKSKEIKDYHELNYLVNDFEISYHYSATLFAQSREKEMQQSEGMLAFAPVFSDELSLTNAPATAQRSEYDTLSTTYRAVDADGNFVPLVYSLEEVNTISKMVKDKNNQKAEVLLFDEANESNLKSKLEQPYRFVHIASHSFANLRESKFSGIACAPPADSTATEDGTLYVGEVYNLDIPADLVVLSSCESGLGKLQAGEGLIGLNRSFIYSGVPNVVFSLWKVNDKVSSDLMIEFYREVLDGEDYAGALRKAKLKLLKDETTASPNLWSSFLLIGR